MILIISNNNKIIKTIYKYIDIKKCLVESEVVDINKYIDEELMSKNIDFIDKIIIDINSLNNNSNEIINAIQRIKVIYDIQIIIIAIGYKVGNEMLSQIFDLGIYDFIISEDKLYQDEEFRNAIKGNNYIDSIKFKVENNIKKKVKIKNKKVKKIKQGNKQKILTCFNFIKNIILFIFKTLGYLILMFLLSVGATCLINSNIRQILIDILKGGI